MDDKPVALLVEDEAQIRRFVRAALEDEGWQVFEAGDCRQGLMAAGTRQPDLVVLDLGLPDGDGVAFIADLRQWSRAAVIVLSARTLESEKVRALDAGADDYLTKPFSARELLARINAVLRRTRMLPPNLTISESSRLRQRLGDDAREPSCIKTVRSEGYVFSLAVQLLESPS